MSNNLNIFLIAKTAGLESPLKEVGTITQNFQAFDTVLEQIEKKAPNTILIQYDFPEEEIGHFLFRFSECLMHKNRYVLLFCPNGIEDEIKIHLRTLGIAYFPTNPDELKNTLLALEF